MCIAIGTKVIVDPRHGYPATIGMLATTTEFSPYRGQGGYYITWDYGRPKEQYESGGGWVMASLVTIAPEDKQDQHQETTMTLTTSTDKPTYPCPLPEQHAPFRATDVIRAMVLAGREEMVHYAGAAHHDRVAWHHVRAWLDQPTRTESECKSLALWRACGVTLSPEQIRAANPGMR